eukprot:6207412-Pleurochrysis_carterae.AAC.4
MSTSPELPGIGEAQPYVSCSPYGIAEYLLITRAELRAGALLPKVNDQNPRPTAVRHSRAAVEYCDADARMKPCSHANAAAQRYCWPKHTATGIRLCYYVIAVKGRAQLTTAGSDIGREGTR